MTLVAAILRTQFLLFGYEPICCLPYRNSPQGHSFLFSTLLLMYSSAFHSLWGKKTGRTSMSWDLQFFWLKFLQSLLGYLVFYFLVISSKSVSTWRIIQVDIKLLAHMSCLEYFLDVALLSLLALNATVEESETRLILFLL